jgi:hypothetical protein
VFGHRRAILASVAVVSVAAAACGARTGLLAPQASSEEDSGSPLPPVVVTVPPTPSTIGCDGGATLIYLVSQQDTLLSFDPPTASFSLIGPLACPVTISSDAAPFSMAVDRSGTAYVVYRNALDQGELFRVSVANAACRATGFVSPPGFTSLYGMGYSTDVADGGEVLYLASSEDKGSRLATLDTSTFTLGVIGPLDPPIVKAELTGTGGGDLFAFWGDDAGSNIAQIDKSSAHSVAQSALPNVFPTWAWAFAIWGGDFYTFTSRDASSGTVVHRFRPADGSIVEVARYKDEIVGAGVSTCAPLR